MSTHVVTEVELRDGRKSPQARLRVEPPVLEDRMGMDGPKYKKTPWVGIPRTQDWWCGYDLLFIWVEDEAGKWVRLAELVHG